MLADRQALAVPQVAVVERPAGSTVYVLAGEQVQARVVHTGIRQDGWVELLDGVKAGELLAVDGAGFLSDKAKVKVKKPAKGKDAAKPAGPSQ